MRKILFRGKRKDNGEWIVGFYNEVRHHDDNSHMHPFIVIPEKFVDNQQNLNFWAEVAPETVGQFTGMTDKNGKKIFEGDIVKWKQYVGCIVYFNMDAMYFLEVPGCPVGLHIDFDTINSSECKIIGNIHDNPELLEGA